MTDDIECLMSRADKEQTFVWIGEDKKKRVVALITIHYFPVLVDKWVVNDALENASSRIAEHVCHALNTTEES